ncbi:MAG: hypothetical protein KA793_01545 [Bacteroidales bacterium]|nr:hypothetical protein [Bacteroidales bacterium]HQL70252.1 hypothetical protein [Bacteroidales bacterium]
MSEPYCCKNLETCKLVHDSGFNAGNKREFYIGHFCNSGTEYLNCKRFITKQSLNFCPDFVLPDTTESPLEIMELFDESETN